MSTDTPESGSYSPTHMLRLALFCLASAAVLVAACGGDDDTGGGAENPESDGGGDTESGGSGSAVATVTAGGETFTFDTDAACEPNEAYGDDFIDFTGWSADGADLFVAQLDREDGEINTTVTYASLDVGARDAFTNSNFDYEVSSINVAESVDYAIDGDTVTGSVAEAQSYESDIESFEFTITCG